MDGVMFKYAIGTTERLEMMLDWDGAIDPRLCAILLELGDWTMRRWSKSIIITCLNRTDEENVSVGGRPKSSHKEGRGGDLRSRNFMPEQIQEILDHVKETWGSEFVHIVYHGDHIHLNINYPFKRGDYGPQKRMS